MELFNVKDKRYKDLNARYKAVSGQDFPLEMMPHETYNTLEQYVSMFEEAGKDLLPEIYDWKYDGSEVY